MNVFSVIINNNSKIDINQLISIRNIFYSSIKDSNKIDNTLFEEKVLSKCILDDNQSVIVCNFLEKTLIKKMINDLKNKNYINIINDYDIMLQSLKEKYLYTKFKRLVK